MKKYFLTLLISISCFHSFSQSDSLKVDTAQTKVAKDFLNKLITKDFTQAMTCCSWDFAGKVNSSALQNIWSSLENQAGPYKACLSCYCERKDGYVIVYQTCQFDNEVLDVKTTMNKDHKIEGFFVAPPKSKEVYKFPAYANNKEVLETELTVHSGKYELPATITYPKTGSHLPAIVLVHGSGPNDRDESIGPNKVFKDLAYGLSSKGFLVLRYEKRTRQYSQEMAAQIDALTLEDETINDAIAAVAEAKKVVAVDASHVYVLGHSLGAMSAPQIAKRSDVAGIIMMAANARPLEDLILEQTQYILSLDGKSKADTAQLDQVKVQVLNAKMVSKESDIDSWQLPLSLPKNYWLYLNNYNQTEVAKSLSLPIFIMQGARDYQVTTTDYNMWQKALAGKPNVQFKLYDKLNHLFMEGTGKSTPAEYDKAGNIPEYVIDDIVKFCK